MIRQLLESCIRNISGAIGIRLRRMYYTKRLGACGDKLTISEGVYFENPKCIQLGNHVWIDRGCKLIAGKVTSNNIATKETNDQIATGEIIIGEQSHIGINTIIQGHGGVHIGAYFTSSPDTKIYSLSNNVSHSKKGTHTIDNNDRHYILSPIKIGKNVWLGANSFMVGGSIGADTFVHPFSLVNGHHEPNSVLAGKPAIKIKTRFK